MKFRYKNNNTVNIIYYINNKQAVLTTLKIPISLDCMIVKNDNSKIDVMCIELVMKDWKYLYNWPL